MFSNLSPSKQGSIGLGIAISYFNMIGNVSIPLLDVQDYDLVVELDNKLKKVQVKTTKFKRNDKYYVELKTTRVTMTKRSLKNFDNSTTDILFILTEDGKRYSIPCSKVTQKTALALTEAYNIYLV